MGGSFPFPHILHQPYLQAGGRSISPGGARGVHAGIRQGDGDHVLGSSFQVKFEPELQYIGPRPNSLLNVEQGWKYFILNILSLGVTGPLKYPRSQGQ